MSVLSILALLSTVIATTAYAGNVLILDTTVSGGMSSIEAQAAVLAGHTPVVVDATTWGSMTTAQFSSYQAIVLGDRLCTSVSAVAPAEANIGVWSPAVTGNVIIDGTDPVLHGKTFLSNGAVAFAAAEAGTGLYTSLSCYYHGVAPNTPVPVLSGLGDFKVRGVGCYNDVHKVADHPALTGVTDATLSNWSCSVHEAFDSYPSSFLPLAIANNVTGTGSVTFADESFGVPYILARGKTLVPIACGNGIIEGTEECDDGNTTNGDGCSAQCKKEVPMLELSCPTAYNTTATSDTCAGPVDVASLVKVTGGDASLTWTPLSPFPSGTTNVTVTATLGGENKTCVIPVIVADTTAPVIGNVTVDTSGLWPSSHKMAMVKLDYTFTDNCNATCRLISNSTDITVKDDKTLLVSVEKCSTSTTESSTTTTDSTTTTTIVTDSTTTDTTTTTATTTSGSTATTTSSGTTATITTVANTGDNTSVSSSTGTTGTTGPLKLSTVTTGAIATTTTECDTDLPIETSIATATSTATCESGCCSGKCGMVRRVIERIVERVTEVFVPCNGSCEKKRLSKRAVLSKRSPHAEHPEPSTSCGKKYTVVVSCTDASGNVSTKEVTIDTNPVV